MVHLHERRIRCHPGGKDAGVLKKQLLNFKGRKTPSKQEVKHEAQGRQNHDDLVMALLVALWLGEQVPQESCRMLVGSDAPAPFVIGSGSTQSSGAMGMSWRSQTPALPSWRG